MSTHARTRCVPYSGVCFSHFALPSLKAGPTYCSSPHGGACGLAGWDGPLGWPAWIAPAPRYGEQDFLNDFWRVPHRANLGHVYHCLAEDLGTPGRDEVR